MASSSSKETWKDSLISQIQKRDERQRSPFKDLIHFHNQMFESWNALKDENNQLSLQIEFLKAGGNSTVNAAAVTSLQNKLVEQAVELAELHKKRSENADLVVRLNEKLRATETIVEQKDERIEEMKKQELFLKQEIDGYCVLQDQVEAKFQMLKDEYQALQLTVTHLEDKLRKVQNENYEMIERIKEYKSLDAEKLNMENENFTRKKNALMQKELAEAARDTRYNVIDDAEDASGLISGLGSLPTTPSVIWDAHDGEVNTVQFSPGPECLLATGGTDRLVKLWDTSRGQAGARGNLVGSNKGIMSVAFDGTGTLLLGTSADGAVRVWGVLEQRPRNSLTGHSNKVLAAKFFGDQTKVVSGSHDRTIKFWDLTKHACIDTIFSCSYCNDLVVSDSSARTVISGHYDKKVKYWDYRVHGSSAKCYSPVAEIHLGANVTSLSLSKDGKSLMACVRDDSLKVVDLRMNQIIKTFSTEGFVVSCDWTRAAFSSNSEYAAVGSQDGSIYIWDALTGKLENTLKKHQNAVIAVAWHPYRTNCLASVDKSKRAIFWS